jgi:hypothetical protein
MFLHLSEDLARIGCPFEFIGLRPFASSEGAYQSEFVDGLNRLVGERVRLAVADGFELLDNLVDDPAQAAATALLAALLQRLRAPFRAVKPRA